MGDYFQTTSTCKTLTPSTIEEKRKKYLIKKAMEHSIACNHQIFLAIIDQNHRLSIFTNEGNPEQFIETYLTNVPYLKDNLSLKDYSNICQEETDLSDERDINTNTVASFDNDKKPITNYYSMRNNATEGNDRLKCFPEYQQHQRNSSVSLKKQTKDTINSHMKRIRTKGDNNSFNEIESINEHFDANKKKGIANCGYDRLIQRGRDNEEDNIVTSENIFQSSLHVYPLERKNRHARYKHGENKKIRIMLESNSDDIQNYACDQNSLGQKRNRENGHYEIVDCSNEDSFKNIGNSNNASPQLSDKSKDFFFQNDTNNFLKTNFLFSSMNVQPFFDESDTQLDRKISDNNNKANATQYNEDNSSEKNANQQIQLEKVHKKETQQSSSLPQAQIQTQNQEQSKTSKANKKIIIIEEGGKAKVISKKEKEMSDLFEYRTKSKKKNSNNYIIFHSNKSAFDNTSNHNDDRD